MNLVRSVVSLSSAIRSTLILSQPSKADLPTCAQKPQALNVSPQPQRSFSTHSAAPHMHDLAERADARQLAQQALEQGAAAPPQTGEVDDPKTVAHS